MRSILGIFLLTLVCLTVVTQTVRACLPPDEWTRPPPNPPSSADFDVDWGAWQNDRAQWLEENGLDC